MNLAPIEAIARAMLYEGYNLYPYRPSALKNRQRWTFGGVFPRDWAIRDGNDRSRMQTQCLLRFGPDAVLDVRFRFLHIIVRDVGELAAPVAALPAQGEPPFRTVARLEIDGAQYLAWEESREREVAAPPLSVQSLFAAPVVVSFAFPAGRAMEPIRQADGSIAGLFVRTNQALSGEITVAAERLGDGVCRLTARIDNTTALPDAADLARDAAQRHSLASTHTLLGVRDGAFVSLLDPPPDLADAATQCENLGTWPVLVGAEGMTDTMLSSPIILYDYPQIAPESPGDLFDGCEIDEILTLRILTLTDDEKREMAAADPRTRALLERTEALTVEELAALHGTFRGHRSAPLPEAAGDARLRVGDRVRLKPRSGGDIMDLVLRGQVAVIEAIERDFENRIHVAVTILDDPGRDLGSARMPGHRFFFAQDEIEPVAPETAP